MSAGTPALPGSLSMRGGPVTAWAAFQHALVVARRCLLQVRANPQLLVFLLIQPLLFVLLFVYVFGGAISGSSRQYVQVVIPGIIVQTAVFPTALMLGLRGGPAITQAAGLYQFLGYCLLVTAGILALRVLVMIFRSSRG